MGEKMIAYKGVVGKLSKVDHLKDLGKNGNINIKMDLKGMSWKGLDFMYLA
jgi:hypothetical protein